MALCQAKNISFSFNDTPVIKQVDLEVYPSEIFALIGPGGCGKSTLIKLLAGILHPQKGEAYFESLNLAGLNYAQHRQLAKDRGMTFQQGGLFDSLTCSENLSFVLEELSSDTRTEREKKISKGLAQVGLKGVEKLQVSELSGGMRKRLAIARAIILDPKLVFLDDPTAGLDPITAHTILDLILDLKEEKKMAVFLVTSEIARALRIADRIAVLSEHKLFGGCSPESLKKDKTPQVYSFIRGEVPV